MTSPVNDLPDDLGAMPPSERGITRKTEILDAALRIIGRDGLGGLSMRALAAEAQMPLGAMGYYFKGKQELIAEAFQRHTQRETERVIKTISDLREGLPYQNLADRLADFVIEGLGEARHQLLAEYAFLVESSRRPELARTSTAWQHSLQTRLHGVLASLGSQSPKTDARLILAVLAGLEIDNLATPLQPAQVRVVKAVLRRLLAALDCLQKHPDGGAVGQRRG